MTTIAHISDTHLGNRQYGSDTRRQDFIDAFDAAVEAAIDADADAIIHTGDLFHRRTPPLPEVNACIRILQRAADADTPFYAIVGNHDRKMDDQWLDLIEHTGTAARLDQSPTIVGGDTDDPAIALYGIDAVPAPAWDSTDFALDPPPDEHEDAYRLLCMHQLLHPPVPEIMADYPTEAVLDRLDTEIDGLALGDYHEAESATVGNVDVWYAGSTERGGAGEAAPRSITLLESTNGDDGDTRFSRRHHELDTRPFRTIDIEFGADDGRAHARDTIQNHDLSDAVAVATLTGKRTSLTAGGVHDLLLEAGAAVGRVDDSRGREHFDVDLDEAPDAAVEDPDTLIGERLAEANLSAATLAVEGEVRGESTATNSLDGTAEDLIMEAQEAAFSEGGPDPADVLAADEDDGSDAEQATDTEADDPNVTTDEGESKPEPAADAGAADGEVGADPTSADGGTAGDDASEAERAVGPESDAEADVTTEESDATTEGSPADDESPTNGEVTDAAEALSSDESPTSGDSPGGDENIDAGERTDGDDPPSSDDPPDTEESTDTDVEEDTDTDSTDAETSTSTDADTDSDAGSTSQASFADLAGDSDADDTGDTQ